MKTELVEVSPVVKQINIELEPAEIKPFYDKTLQKYSRLASIPGFRKGYAPAAIVKTRFREDINNDVLRDLLPERVTEAIQEHQLSPLSEPRLSLENPETYNASGSEPLKLQIFVEVLPQIDTANYKGLEAVRRVRPVDEEAIEKLIQERRQEHASFVPIEDRPAAVGDTITVDINGVFIDNAEDEEAEPINVEDLEIELGSQNVQEEFTTNLVGVQPDDKRTFTIQYPEDFTSPGLAGKKLEYTAIVKSVGRVELPEVNDEWVQSLDEGEDKYKTVGDLRNKLRQDLETMAKLESDNRLRDELMNKLIDANPIDVPPTLTSYQAQGLTRQFASNIERQGIDMRNVDQKLLQMMYERMLPQAEREVRGALLLDKISALENIEVNETEINDEIESIARYSHRSAEEVRQTLASGENGANEIRDRLRNRKAIEVMVENAVITDGEWQEENAQATGDELAAGFEDDQATAETPETETESPSAASESESAAVVTEQAPKKSSSKKTSGKKVSADSAQNKAVSEETPDASVNESESATAASES
jgi:trigger factor